MTILHICDSPSPSVSVSRSPSLSPSLSLSLSLSLCVCVPYTVAHTYSDVYKNVCTASNAFMYILCELLTRVCERSFRAWAELHPIQLHWFASRAIRRRKLHTRAHAHTDRHTDRQSDRHPDTQTATQRFVLIVPWLTGRRRPRHDSL